MSPAGCPSLFSSVSTNTFGGGTCYCTPEYRPANSTQFRYTTNRCRKCNSTKYKGFKFKGFQFKFKSNYHRVGLITMLILKVFLLTIIMATAPTEVPLKKKFVLDEIIFRTIPHPLPCYNYIAPLFDAQFGNKSILKDDLVSEGIIVENSGFKQYYSDVVNRLRSFITAHVKSVVLSDDDDCERKMEKVQLMTIRKSGFSLLSNARQFNTANTAYHADEDKRHDDINNTECFIIYLDIHQLYPTRTEYIDALDWTKIHLSLQPDPSATSPTPVTTTTQPTAIDRLVAAMDQQYKDAHSLKEETLVKYDPVSGKGVPEECISCHDLYNKPNYIMTKSEMKKFKNELTPDGNNPPVSQEQNFVTIGTDGNQYCINRDGSLFRYLKHQSSKNRKEYINKFPFIYEWSPEGWADFRYRGMRCAYLHFAWVPSYNLVCKGRGTQGFIMADPQVDPDCDVPICYQSQRMGWSKSISDAVNCPEFLAHLKTILHGKQPISFINSCGDEGMQFLQLGDQVFHAALI